MVNAAPSFESEDGLEVLLFEEIPKISIATMKETDIKKTPGVVSVVSRADIVNSGARDLMEVLQLYVPGFDFAYDTEGSIGDSFRGMWGYEGKILFMVDGQEMNDGVYANVVFGNHFCIDNVEKVEVIRGPGSAIYGGYAGLAVVNVVSRGSYLNDSGGYVSYTDSEISGTFSHRNLGFGFAAPTKKDFKCNITGVYGLGNRSSRTHYDYSTGEAKSLKGNAEQNVTNFNINLNYKKVDFRAIIDNYNSSYPDPWGKMWPQKAIPENFKYWFYQLKYDYNLNDNILIVPKLKYKIQYPFNIWVPPAIDDTYGWAYTNARHSEKKEADLHLIWDINEKDNLTLGIECFDDRMYRPVNPEPTEEIFRNGKDNMGWQNTALFAQYLKFTDIVNITLGARYDWTSEFGSSFNPRMGLTKDFENCHFKAMYGRSFRTPNGIIPNRLFSGTSIEPEFASTYELEFGFKASEKDAFTINVYDVSFDNMIVNTYDAAISLARYQNAGELRNRGFEAEYKHIGNIFSATLNCSYYTKVKSNSVIDSFYLVPEEVDNDSVLGIAQNRVNGIIRFKLAENISLNPSCTYYGKRYGYVQNGLPIQQFDPMTLLNINARFGNCFGIYGLEIALGIRNITNRNFVVIQPYNGGNAPMQVLDRAYVIKTTYSF